MRSTAHPQLLLAIVRGDWRRAEALLRAGASRPAAEFVECCRLSDVHARVHAALVRQEQLIGLLEPGVLEGLAALRHKVTQDNMLLLGRAEQALDLLLDAGVIPLALKGLDLLHRVYDRFDERTLDDVDLLIRREDLQRAFSALEAAGWTLPPEPKRTHYVRSSHHLPLYSPGPITVDFEIHWNLAQERRYRISADDLFDRAQPIEIAGREILRLDDHDLVAHLLVHHFSHYFDRRLKWLVDLQKITTQDDFDWARVGARIKEWDGVAACAVSLRHLHKLQPELIPDSILSRLPVSWWRSALTLPLRSAHPLELFRHTGRRQTQLYLAAVMLENPLHLPAYLLHRRLRDARPGENPLDEVVTGGGEEPRNDTNAVRKEAR